MASLVMTVLGQDQPGLVESLAKVVNQFGANWLESRMAHLAGQFAGIVHVEVDAGQANRLVDALRQLDQQGLTVIVQQEADAQRQEPFAPLVMELVGGDRPGIVHEVTHVLAARQVNVEEFQSECVSAPMSGGKLFRVTAQLRLPHGLSQQQLQHDLEQIAHDMMVDIQLKSTPAA